MHRRLFYMISSFHLIGWRQLRLAHRTLTVIVTTGDLANERRLYAVHPTTRELRQLRGSWSGFTAAATLPNGVHFGTDLLARNGFLRFADRLDQPPEYRALPEHCDAPVRNLIAIDAQRMLAWCRIEDPHPGATEVWTVLLLTEDAGQSWQCVHRSTGNSEEVAENVMLERVNPIRVLTVMTSRPERLQVT